MGAACKGVKVIDLGALAHLYARCHHGIRIFLDRTAPITREVKSFGGSRSGIDRMPKAIRPSASSSNSSELSFMSGPSSLSGRAPWPDPETVSESAAERSESFFLIPILPQDIPQLLQTPMNPHPDPTFRNLERGGDLLDG